MPGNCKCGRPLQGMDRVQLASGKCERCYAGTREGERHYKELSREAERRLGPNWKNIVSGFGDQ